MEVRAPIRHSVNHVVTCPMFWPGKNIQCCWQERKNHCPKCRNSWKISHSQACWSLYVPPSLRISWLLTLQLSSYPFRDPLYLLLERSESEELSLEEQILLACCYGIGIGTQRDIEQALRLCVQA